ncbi:MAG: hypothetical protein OEW89_09975 [Gammaproteobacteria bacterium]|nr:hypothetical protein [Gammaproteobacteria bacterium]MDH5614412.1 hypothetical protein [Gammaproteobacteria bacterium]
MEHNLVYNKTEKGKDEIVTKKWGLNLNLRRILILVDGKKDVASLLSKGSVFKDIESSLEELSRDGYIEIAGKSDSTGSSESSPSINLQSSAGSDDPKQQLIDLAINILGEKDSGKIVEKLYASASNKDDLLTTAKNCSKIIKLTIDEDKAKTFLNNAIKLIR